MKASLTRFNNDTHSICILLLSTICTEGECTYFNIYVKRLIIVLCIKESGKEEIKYHTERKNINKT